MLFINRTAAGRRLAEQLRHLRGQDVVVLGLPRGGVLVAFEVARALAAPLDVIVVRKLGVPFQPELAMGAIGEDGVRVLNEAVLRRAQVSTAELAEVEQQEQAELRRQARRFRGDRPRLPLVGRTALLVDDGIATGSTARAACRIARALGAKRVVLAAPVGSSDAVGELRNAADEVVCPETASWFLGIGQWYADFSQISDEEVVGVLQRAAQATPPPDATRSVPNDPLLRDEAVEVPAGSARLAGHLTMPRPADGIVVFAHGSGSSSHSPRNRYLAAVLNQAGLGTLRFDLLTPDEELNRANIFDIELLASRLIDVTAWLRAQPEGRSWRIGYFGASTGAAAALWAAAELPDDVAAVAARGGRPDLAAARLPEVRAPTLLIVGSRDDVVLDLNRRAQNQLSCENRLVVVPGAGHLFEEPGTLAAAARQARDWFVGHLLPVAHPSS